MQGFADENSVGTMLRMMCERDDRVYMNYKHGKMKEYFQYIKQQPIPLNTESLNTDLQQIYKRQALLDTIRGKKARELWAMLVSPNVEDIEKHEVVLKKRPQQSVPTRVVERRTES